MMTLPRVTLGFVIGGLVMLLILILFGRKERSRQ